MSYLTLKQLSFLDIRLTKGVLNLRVLRKSNVEVIVK